MNGNDTIAAVASGVTNSGISIIRVSGDNAINVVDQCFVCKENWAESVSHTVHYGHIVENGELIDEVLVLLFRAPKTYTKENVVEIDCHGGALITKRVLECVVNAGARPAEPGEFTKRAFLNGRIDLSQAEAVMEVIEASNRFALKNSIRQLRGAVKERVTEIRQTVLYDIAAIEAALDDPEHSSFAEYENTFCENITRCRNQIKELLKNADQGRLINEGINVVILGRPNVGKSTLLNLLAKEDRAIVTDIAGTTRDLLEVPVCLNNMQLNITDTAGIRETDDTIEKIGVERALKSANNADLVLYVFDTTVFPDKEELSWIRAAEQPVLALLNKSDLSAKISKPELASLLPCDVIEISAKESKGFEELAQKIEDLILRDAPKSEEQLYITNLRHKNALQEALESIDKVVESLEIGMPEDFLSIDMMECYRSLGTIIGETVEDDLVDAIFSKFCMGK